MNAPRSQGRKRQRPPAREQLTAARDELVERLRTLASYEHVLADMGRRSLPPFGGSQAIAMVVVCRDAARRECDELAKIVTDLEKKVPCLSG